MAFVEQSLPLSEVQVEEQLLQGHFFWGGSCRKRLLQMKYPHERLLMHTSFPKVLRSQALYVCLMVFSLHEEVPDEELQECERMISQLESPSSKAEVGRGFAADLFFHEGYSIQQFRDRR